MQNKGHIFTRLLIIALLALLGACEPVKDIGEPGVSSGQPTQAQQLEQAGKFREAADEYLRVAGKSVSPQKENLQLDAIQALLNGKLLTEAETLILKLQIPSTDVANTIRLGIVKAQLYLARNQPQQALDVLMPLPADAGIPLRTWYHRLRAQAYLLLGNYLESARERIMLAPLLVDVEKTRENRHKIWESINQLSALALMQLRTEPPPNELSGWMSLAYTGKTSLLDPEKFRQEIATWKQEYPTHPAMEDILPELLARHQALKRPERLALILPLTGKLAKPAEVIRDGFLAAHFSNENGRQKTHIAIYDSGAPGADIWQLYSKAVQEGAEYVIGPLDKSHVTRLATAGELPIPVLALNTLDTLVTPPNNFYQFALSPEDEARQVAERASLDGLIRAVTITPRGDWGERVLAAFTKRFTELGGEVLKQETYEFSQNDFSGPLQRMLNLDESYQRLHNLKVMLGEKIEFEPRRRQDVDFIFMAAFPVQARLIAPQLRFHHAADLPVYATSHAYNGTQKIRENRDMNGITLCDSSWTLSQSSLEHPLREKFTKLWPEKMEQFPRLFAMGIDAYQLPARLKWMRENPADRYEGKTGLLYMNEHNQLQRILQWARFIGGRATMLQPTEVAPQNKNPPGKSLTITP